MTNAIEEFLTENSFRSFPFRGDTSLAYVGGLLDNAVVLDFRGWHRKRAGQEPMLAAIIGPDGSGAGDFIPNDGFISFYFTAGPDDDLLIWRFLVPVLGGQFPMSVLSSVSDPSYAGVNLGVARATFGAAALNIPDDADWLFTTAKLESGLVVECARNQVDEIRVVHDEGDDDIVGGDLRIFGGYNVDVIPAADGGLKITATPGAGTLGRYLGSRSDPGQSKCAGVLMSLAGVAPDEDTRNITIAGEKGIEIENLPDEHRIIIRMAKPQLAGNVCS